MNVDTEVEVVKPDDPNQGREGTIAQIVPRILQSPRYRVRFETPEDTAEYGVDEIRPVRVRPSAGQQSAARPMEDIWKGFG